MSAMLVALTAPKVGIAQGATPVDGARSMVLHCDAVEGLRAGTLQVTVNGGTDHDHQFVCAAARRAVAFFLGNGLTPELRLQVRFGEAIFLDLCSGTSVRGLDPVQGSGCIAQPERVAGIYSRGSRTVLMTTEASPWLDSYTYFGLPISDEMFTSMLTHEITHALSESLYAPALRTAKVDIRVQEEYVAYVAQLSSMSPDLRTAVLAHFAASAHRFEDETDINAWALDLSPEAFGVKCYQHFTDDAGGPVFLRRLYGGDYRPPVHVLY